MRINPTRLRLARERSGLLAKDLALRCSVTPQTVSHWETGQTEPGEAFVRVIAAETGFDQSFFYAKDIDPLPAGAVAFRARTKMTARARNSALAAGEMASELAQWIEMRFKLPAVELPNLVGQPPDLVARVIRQEWMLGEHPIENVVRLLESRGVIVFSLAQDCLDLDAFSFWSNKRPIVIMNTMKSAERSRIDAAHELFHLLAHREETGKEEEREADRFAGTLLMPSNDIYRRLKRALSLNKLIEEKQRWGVSLAALVYRLRELQILTDWQYRMFFIELSKRGYRTREPNPIRSRDESAILAQVFGTRDGGANLRRAGADLGWRRRQLEEFLFGLGAALLAVEGGRQATIRPRPKLRLVGPED